jgi:hypothetical protein
LKKKPLTEAQYAELQKKYESELKALNDRHDSAITKLTKKYHELFDVQF